MKTESTGFKKYLLWAVPVIFAVVCHIFIKYVVTDYELPGIETNVMITGSNLTLFRSEHLTLIGRGANDEIDLYKSLGWMHARDRYVQMCLMRIASQGRLTEIFPYDATNHQFDLIAKQFNFHGRNKDIYTKYEKGGLATRIINAYTEGINEYINNNNRPFEFILVNYHPEPFVPTDITTFVGFVSYIGLDEICFQAEKLIIGLARSNSMSSKSLKQLFHPHLQNLTTEHIELFKSIIDLKSNSGLKSPFIPSITNSNNWVISGAISRSGSPIMSSDPHLDVSKYPNTFYESTYIAHTGETTFGISVPGIPLILMGRNKHVSFSLTYGMLDMGDYFMERIENEQYERDGRFIPLNIRKYVVTGEDVIFYETDEGHIIERSTEDYGKPIKDGIYLALRVPDRMDELVYRHSMLPFSKTVQEAQRLLPQSKLAVNYLLADSQGNIGYQQAGSVPLRPTSHGLLPLPAWDSGNLWAGYLSDEDYKVDLNPPENFIATANNYIQDPHKPQVITYPAIPTRVNRISELLRSKNNHSVEDMMKYQGDTFSTLAELTIPLLEPFLPKSGIGNELRHWDRRFQVDSRPSALWFDFWAEYTANINTLVIGKEQYDILESHVFNKYLFYKIAIFGLQNGDFDGHNVTSVLKQSIETALSRYSGAVYGDIRKYFSNNIFFSGKLPGWLGLDIGPYPTNGGIEVLKVGSEDTYLNTACVFTQTWRFITDMSSEVFYSILPGGPSGNYFSNIYGREVDNILKEIYKVWSL